jgi:hypothetical protein
MGVFSKNSWKEWARQWGLTYHAPRFLGTAREWMAGAHRSFLVKAGWLGDRHVEFYVHIRFPKVPDPAVIRQRLLDDQALAGLPGWSKIKPAQAGKSAGLFAFPSGGSVKIARANIVGTKPLIVDDSSVLWTRPCPWRRPKAEQLQAWVDTLVVALSQTTRAFDGHCEECGRDVGERFVMVNDVPVHLCESCQQDLVQKGRVAEMQYDEGSANHLLGAFYATAAAVAGGALWAAISFFTGRMFALVAIGIALLVGFAYRLGAKKMDLAGQAIGVALTMVGVLLGDILFYAALVMQRQPEVGFRLDAGWYVFMKLLGNSPGDVVISMLFGLIGSIYVVRMLARPKFVPKIEPADQTKAAA